MSPDNQLRIGKHNHISYDVNQRYWSGPTARAFEAFTNTQPQSRLSEIEYLDHLQSNFADFYMSIEWVTFQRGRCSRQKRESNHQDLWLALTYTKPNPKHRDELFNVREQITANTGWYPLVLGSRATLSGPEYQGIRSLLFHNGSDTLKKWIRDNQFDPVLVMPLRHSPIFLKDLG